MGGAFGATGAFLIGRRLGRNPLERLADERIRLGTAMGLVPRAFVYAVFGGTLDDPLSPGFVGAILGIVLFLAAGTAAERWLRARNAAV